MKILPGASGSGQDGHRFSIERCAMQEAFRKVLVKMSCPAKVLPAESGSPAEVALRREIVYANGAGGSVRSRWVSYPHGLHVSNEACCFED